MQLYSDSIDTTRGAPLRGATVTVRLDGALATIYDADGVAQANPMTTDSTGSFSFRAVNGEYTATIEKVGIETKSTTFQLYDPADDPASADSLAAADGAALIGFAGDAISGGATTAQAALRSLMAPSNASKTIEKMRLGSAVKIVCYGDSITYGYQAGTGNQVATPYPAALQARLRTCYGNTNITVINRGNSGWQTDEALASLQSLVLDEAPDMAIVMFGINDARSSVVGGSALSLDAYRSNLIEIIRRLKDAGVEVVVMSPNPILDTTNAVHRKLLSYVRAASEAAAAHRVPFINLHREIRSRFQSKAEAPTLLLPDNLHFADAKYSLIADIVMGKLLDFHNGGARLTITSRDEFREPAYKSAFVDTDCSVSYTNVGQPYQTNYVLRSDGTAGTYLRFSFYVEVASMDLVLKAPRNNQGGQITVRDNGVALRTLDFYSNEVHAFDSEDVLIENIAQGYHVIEFLLADLVSGQSLNGSYGNAYVEHFLFRPTRAAPQTLTYNRVTGGVHGVIEAFKRIISGTARFTNGLATDTGVLFLGADSAELRTGKTLVIEAEGKFFSGSGISWFGNPARGELAADNPSLANTGYLVYFEGTGASAARLYSFIVNNGYGTALSSVTQTMDYAVTHKIRITHTVAGLITVYLDGVQIIQVTNTKARNGFFGLYTHLAGTIELSRLEYAYF